MQIPVVEHTEIKEEKEKLEPDLAAQCDIPGPNDAPDSDLGKSEEPNIVECATLDPIGNPQVEIPNKEDQNSQTSEEKKQGIQEPIPTDTISDEEKFGCKHEQEGIINKKSDADSEQRTPLPVIGSAAQTYYGPKSDTPTYKSVDETQIILLQQPKCEKSYEKGGKHLNFTGLLNIKMLSFDLFAEVPKPLKFLKKMMARKKEPDKEPTAFTKAKYADTGKRHFPTKSCYPGSSLIPYTLKNFKCDELVNLRASSTFMPYSLFLKLGPDLLAPDPFKLTNISLKTNYSKIWRHNGIFEILYVRMKGWIFPMNFKEKINNFCPLKEKFEKVKFTDWVVIKIKFTYLSPYSCRPPDPLSVGAFKNPP